MSFIDTLIEKRVFPEMNCAATGLTLERIDDMIERLKDNCHILGTIYLCLEPGFESFEREFESFVREFNKITDYRCQFESYGVTAFVYANFIGFNALINHPRDLKDCLRMMGYPTNAIGSPEGEAAMSRYRVAWLQHIKSILYPHA